MSDINDEMQGYAWPAERSSTDASIARKVHAAMNRTWRYDDGRPEPLTDDDIDAENEAHDAQIMSASPKAFQIYVSDSLSSLPCAECGEQTPPGDTFCCEQCFTDFKTMRTAQEVAQ